MRLMLHQYRIRPIYESIFKRQTGRLSTSFTLSKFVTPPKKRFFVPSLSLRTYHQAAMSTSNPTPEEPAKPVEEKTETVVEELPPLSDREFKIYNRLAEKMDYFHDHFRRSWNLLWTACTTNKRPQGMSLKQFLLEGIQFADHLTAHHGIEETYVFPVLAKKMPEFRGGRAELLRQHKQIHAGLDVFAEYLRQCRAGEADFEMDVLKEKMEGWGEVLWKHLDEEVKTLGAENMRRYWTKEEIMRLPM